MRGRPRLENSIVVRAYELFKQYNSVQRVAKELGIAPQTVRTLRDTTFKEWATNPDAFATAKAQGTASTAKACHAQEVELLQNMLTTVSIIIAEKTVKPTKWSEILDTVKLVLDRLARMVPQDGKPLEGEDLAQVSSLIDTAAKAVAAGGNGAQEALQDFIPKEEVVSGDGNAGEQPNDTNNTDEFTEGSA